MELLSVNVSGKTRKATLNGREYVVAPLTMIVPGVLNGSKGALLYPSEEIARDPSSWNGMPLTLGHPVENGAHVSGRSPEVWDRLLLGHVFNATVDDKGRLKAEGWFDSETVRRADAGVLDALASGKPVELSTGLFTENEPAPDGATHNGRPYQFIAKNYRPDHLAILIGQTGACSVADGCGVGVLVNESCILNAEGVCLNCGGKPGGNAELDLITLAENAGGNCGIGPGGFQSGNRCGGGGGGGGRAGKKNHSEKELKGIAEKLKGEKGVVILDTPKGKFKIRNGDDVREFLAAGGKLPKHVANADGCGVGVVNEEAATKNVKKAETVPVKCPHDGMEMKDGKCPKCGYKAPVGKSGITPNQEGNTNMDKQAAVEWLTANCDCWKGEEETLNALADEKVALLRTGAEKAAADATFVTNATKPPPEPKPDPVPAPAPKPVSPSKAKSAAEYFAEAPDEVQSIMRNAVAVVNQEKQKIVAALVGNVQDDAQRQAAAAVYGKMDLDELRLLAPTVPVANDNPFSVPNYFGAAAGATTANARDDSDNVLPETVYNFDEFASQKLRKQA